MLSLLWKALAVGAFFLSLYWVRRQRRVRLEREQLAEDTLSEAQQALEQAEQRKHQLVEILTALQDYHVTPTGRRPWKELADFTVQTAGQLLGTKIVILFQCDPLTEEFVGSAAVGVAPLLCSDLRIRVGEGVLGRAVRDGRSLLGSESFGSESTPLSAQEKYITPPCLVLPLRGRLHIHGLLVVSRPLRNEFTNEPIRVATLLAKQLETVMDNLSLDENRERLYEELVDSLIRTLQVKENQSQEHAENCRRLVQALADELHLPAVLKEQFVYGALLHDIGKIGVDERILLKPGSLTPEEMAAVKKHPEFGYHMIREVSFLKGVAPIVLYHQEWVNGQGYPEGLAGEEIPLGARLVGLVDAWDAMTHDQPYRKALTRHHAMAELRQQAGSQFDPKLVDVFLKVVEHMDHAPSSASATSRRTMVSPSAVQPHG